MKLPPCKACTILTESFKKGMDKTKRGKHEGGDAAWESEKLKDYRKSIVRLTEVQEMLCREVSRGEDQCHQLADEHEGIIEEWWYKHQDEHPELFPWLCITKLEVCCPPNKFGPNCDLCSDCNGNGKCKGNGTRKGNGKCACDEGYTGEFCTDCSIGFYESFRDETKLLCSKCHQACGDDGCSAGGPKQCKSCRKGWTFTPDSGCFDINECLTSNICKENQFCVNNDGSYSCLECDRSCRGCQGDGPDMCLGCAENFELREGKCVDLTTEKREQYVSLTRFLTYLGLCIATCAIFQSSTAVASIVGIAVAIYIGASEYWLNTSPSAVSPQIDTKQLEDMIKNSL